MARLSVLAATLALLCVVNVSHARVTYPLFRQCDPRWGSTLMGTPGPGERATICKEGCAMTSLSMALNGLGVDIDGQPATPATVNKWLEDHHGYTCAAGDCNNLVLSAPDRITPMFKLVGEVPPPPVEEIRRNLTAQSQVLLAHVHHQGHFVLLTGYDEEAGMFTVNDPFFNTTMYAYADIHDIITYYVRKPVVQPTPLTAVIPNTYPLYKQCNASWGNDIMETTTICKVGCLMSSTSMAIGGKNLAIDGQLSDPATLNTWLRGNSGYTSGNDLIESAVPQINPSHIQWPSDAMHPTNNIPMSGIRAYLKAGRPVIANVMHGHHFVLVVGWDTANNDTLYVNDPGFNRNTYSYSQDVVGWRLFQMEAADE